MSDKHLSWKENDEQIIIVFYMLVTLVEVNWIKQKLDIVRLHHKEKKVLLDTSC